MNADQHRVLPTVLSPTSADLLREFKGIDPISVKLHPLSLDKVHGVLLGTAIGDALGMPVETLTAEEIASKFGRISDFISNPTHKWFHGAPAGQWTDDTQLTLAIAESIVASGGFNLDSLAKYHRRAHALSETGWGRTTRDAVRRLEEGVSPADSGAPSFPGAGLGNGVVMKIAPLAILAKGRGFASTEAICSDALRLNDMTHATPLSRAATVAHLYALLYCLDHSPESFKPAECAAWVLRGATQVGSAVDEHHALLVSRLTLLHDAAAMSDQQIIEACQGGHCYVAESLPLSLLFFIRNPRSFECVMDTVNAGGDTDSNASMVGALLGALHGAEIFPRSLADKISEGARIRQIAHQLFDTLNT